MLSVTACVLLCQLGGEEDGVRADPILEPHHTHHTVGEADQVRSKTCWLLKINDEMKRCRTHGFSGV